MTINNQEWAEIWANLAEIELEIQWAEFEVQGNKRESEHMRRLIASNPTMPPAVLAGLAKDDSPHVLEKVAANPNTPADTLVALSWHEDPEVRAAVAENLSCPAETLRLLACDQASDVRYTIAENHNVPERILLYLCEDENPYIAHRATKTLGRLRSSSGNNIVSGRFEQFGENQGKRQQGFL